MDPITLIHALLGTFRFAQKCREYTRRDLPSEYLDNPRIPLFRAAGYVLLVLALGVMAILSGWWLVKYLEGSPTFWPTAVGIVSMLGALVVAMYGLVHVAAGLVDWLRSSRIHAERKLTVNWRQNEPINPA